MDTIQQDLDYKKKRFLQISRLKTKRLKRKSFSKRFLHGKMRVVFFPFYLISEFYTKLCKKVSYYNPLSYLPFILSLMSIYSGFYLVVIILWQNYFAVFTKFNDFLSLIFCIFPLSYSMVSFTMDKKIKNREYLESLFYQMLGVFSVTVSVSSLLIWVIDLMEQPEKKWYNETT